MIDVVPRVGAAVAALGRSEPVVLTDTATDVAALVLSAGTTEPSTVAFLVRHTSGFLCAAMPPQVPDRLRIPVSPARDLHFPDFEFGISVDAVGTGTGISASARAATLRRLADPAAAAEDFTRPGHVITVRVRAAHALPVSLPSGAVELVRAAGDEPVAAYGHLVGERDPTGLATTREAEGFARRERPATVSIAELGHRGRSGPGCRLACGG
ncbi:3,4-dihydroxy-2-butanone-4-phosphate synthase [Amycolatopsis alkalitolerans]|uniref:3,4-dihydroxy-2-butanone-4-phosphate synthase n=1 Tax=Amycolatopsis alkalitolerans TaxID=2547244 RepID=UPI00135A9350|nr:3,4-dihydroxy-2-butanone-4-phosphate synthase [Amycolatopsis alkalitolerans]